MTRMLLLLLLLPVLAAAQPAEPPATLTLTLTEQWRVGGPDSDLLFGTMIEAVADADGRVYLLDQQLSHAVVVEADGTVTGFLGAEGDGPGEVRTPQDIMLMPDGTVALAQQFPGKLIRLQPDGTPADNVTVGVTGKAAGGFTVIAGCTGRGGTLLIGALLQAPTESGQSRLSYLARIGADGSEQVRYCEHLTQLDFKKAHFVEREMLAPFLGAHAVAPDGTVYAAPDRNAYRIEAYAPDGALRHTFGRDFVPVPRDQREIDRMNELFEVQDAKLPFDTTWEVETTDQTIVGLRVDARGDLWVEHARSDEDRPAGVFKTYDVFDGDGAWRRRVSVACAGDPRHDDLIFLDDGRVLFVRGLVLARLTASGSEGAVFDEDDVPEAQEVVCYTVE
jgi:hypothetical protein